MSDRFQEVVQNLVNTKTSVSVTAAAGCGKTEAIVQAVAQTEGRQLILTHTNAGVAALRSRLRKNAVSESKYRVTTIASWLLKYSVAYPSMSGFANPRPQGDDWNKVYPAAQGLFVYQFIKDVLQSTYQGVFVDEYQDCTQKQHAVILKMSEYLPVRVLGDFLQGIFGFQNDPLVNWQTDIALTFQKLPNLTEPYRWSKTNPELGKQLAQIRDKLLNNEEIKLNAYSEIKWHPWTEDQEKEICQDADIKKSGTITGIHQWPNNARTTAGWMGGKYHSIEEMDCKDLMSTACKIEQWRTQGNYRAIGIEIKNFILKGCGNRAPFSDPNYLYTEFLRIGQGDLTIISDIMEIITRNPKMQVYRHELFGEMKRAAQEFALGKSASFDEAAYAVRYRTRQNGRKLESRIISTTLLIKGLEFDHAIVLNADTLQNRENLYVAITRGSQSLTVLSISPVVHYAITS
ncbi:MAG: AAA family ATPase [Pelolinea sp.]|nr:AAA family ATPase [Pelolinea sp.]